MTPENGVTRPSRVESQIGMPEFVALHDRHPGRVCVRDKVAIGVDVTDVKHLQIRKPEPASHLDVRRHVVQLAEQGSKRNMPFVV